VTAETGAEQAALSLWSDDPSSTDLLSFDAVASTVADALLDAALDPVALGLSGPWGSGKTTVLGLVEQELDRRTEGAAQQVLVIRTDPWRYDPATGAKESLIGEVLTALSDAVDASETKTERVQKLVKRLAQRVDWAKAIKLAAKTSLAFQIPSVDNLVDLIKPAGGDDNEERGLEAFRDEFRELMASDDLAHISAVAVLVDDLDRCLPETVVEALEAIRLFLAVPKMSFVIAADEERVADAIRTRFAEVKRREPSDVEGEEPAKLYLHKIVQTTIPLPNLSRFDTQAYLLLLQLQPKLGSSALTKVIDQCAHVRRAGGGMDDLPGGDGLDMTEELAFASRLTPILYEKLHGNPRRIKRFLNDLRVRQSIASRRGIGLDPAIIAKLMVLEVLLPKEFKKVLDWLAQGTLRDQLIKLEAAAGRPTTRPDKKKQADEPSSDDEAPVGEQPHDGDLSEGLLRWAKLPPPLGGVDLAPYLYLAASFSGVTLLDTSLPERLRDIASNLLSSSQADRRSVSDEDLDALSATEAEALVQHLGRTIRDQPTKQKTGVTGVLRLARQRTAAAEVAAKALLMLPPDEIALGTPLLFTPDDPSEVQAVLTEWQSQSTNPAVIRAIKTALKQGDGT